MIINEDNIWLFIIGFVVLIVPAWLYGNAYKTYPDVVSIIIILGTMILYNILMAFTGIPVPESGSTAIQETRNPIILRGLVGLGLGVILNGILGILSHFIYNIYSKITEKKGRH